MASLIHLKVSAYKVLARVQGGVAALLRSIPGVPSLLGIPKKRIRSIRDWIETERLQMDWWERYDGPYFDLVRPPFPQPAFIDANNAVQKQNGICSSIRKYHVHSAIFLAGIPNAKLLGPDGVVLTQDGAAMEESTWGMGGLDKHRALTSLKLPRPEVHAGHFFTIAGPSAEGYAHWIFEVLPRLSLLERVPSETPTLVVSGPLNSWQRESLVLLGLDHLPVLPLQNRYLQVEFLHFPSYVGKAGTAHPDACQWLRNQLIDHDEQLSGRPRRIYITRRQAGRRHIINEAAIEPVLASFGFEIVEAETLSLRDQIRLFSEAEAVVGVHGAGLSNLVFAPASCKVLEIFAPTCVRWMYYHLSSVMKQEYWYLMGERTVPSGYVHQDEGFDSLELSPEHLGTTLNAMLALPRR